MEVVGIDTEAVVESIDPVVEPVTDLSPPTNLENPQPEDTPEDTLQDPPFTFAELSPAAWDLIAKEDGIYGHNSTTGRVFEGTIEEFNQKLRA